MKRNSRMMRCTVLSLLVLICQFAAAQDDTGKEEKQGPKAPASATRLTLGSTSGTPGTSVVVPIYFTAADGVRVGKLQIQVNYVSANMKFLKLDSGYSLESANVELKSEVKEGKNDKGVDTQTVMLRAALPASDAAKSAIPPGLLGYLTLQISDNGRPASITLRVAAEANDLGTGQPVRDLQTADATVDVLAPGSQPAVACFFFTH
jgi:cohesin domain-containing protein